MELLSNLLGGVWYYGIVFLMLLTFVVFIHELGHFLVARWCGVAVKAFSIGFGPEIFGFYDKHGTRWRFAWIPLGGYVKFMDDDNAASKPSPEAIKRMSPEERASAFHAKPVWQRAAVVAAGPMANFLLAIVIYTGLNAAVGVRLMPAYVESVRPGGPAEAAGFLPGDKIVAIDGAAVESFEEMKRIVAPSAGVALTFLVQRNGQSLELKATPDVKEDKDYFGRTFRQGLIGISGGKAADKEIVLSVGPIEALIRGVRQTWVDISSTISGLGQIISNRQSSEQMGGPIFMAEAAGTVAKAGFIPLISLIAAISANIGFLNLLPIPILGRWPPFVLRDRGGLPKAPQRTRPAHRIPDRTRHHRRLDDFREFQRLGYRRAAPSGGQLERRSVTYSCHFQKRL